MGSLRTAALGLTVLAVGCATGGATLQQFNPQGETLKTIALISVPNPVQYTAVDYGGKAGLFGAIGGAAIAADAKTMSETLTKTASDARFDYGREMQAALVDRLKRAGFKVVMVRAEYAKVPSGEADALLDVDARIVGYATYNITDPDFRPYVSADVRLVSARTRAVLYSEQIMFGYHNPFMSATQLPSDKKYYFKDFNALMADKPRALEGMREGTKVIADHVAQRLTTK
jgi:hypothetical protein